MELFKNSLNTLDSILQNKQQNIHFDTLNKSLTENLSKAQGIIPLEQEKVMAKADFSELQNLFGIHRFSFVEPRIGPHPDFSHLEHEQYLNHYAVSMFLDIKGSTQLSKKYTLLQIRKIKDTILTLAIEVCSFFGGHIQRLQGDGIFVYFVRKDLYDNDAIINSLNSASLMSFFMKYKLPQHFKDGDITPPKVRIGIDYGDKEKTIWSYYGLKYCSELTTTGLHTDLAAKLQNKADPNGIRVGDNVVQMLDLEDKFVKTDPNEEFIFDNSYRQYIFNWEEYLLSFDFIKRDSNRNVIIEKPSYRLSCEISEQDKDQYVPYRQNLYSIPKHYKIRFTLLENDIPYKLKIAFDEHLEWKIVNTGKEATKAQKIKETIQPAKDSVICVVDALFLGHHEMQCKIIKSGGISNINVRHSVFVR